MTVRWNRREGGGAYDFFRRRLGRAILLGLEFLVAADIIRTVAVTPSAESVAVLAGIVLIRTFLSFSRQLEMKGAWPWQQRSTVATDQSHGRSAAPCQRGDRDLSQMLIGPSTPDDWQPAGLRVS